MSLRAAASVCIVAATIADLEGSVSVRRLHLAEALIYRRVVPGSTSDGVFSAPCQAQGSKSP
ncbi:MAG: hypothetical protein WCP82_00120 [Alphaproteobacteria bacterium]